MSRRVKITANGDVTGTRVVDAETGEPIRATRVEFSHGVGELPKVRLETIGDDAELECEAEIRRRLTLVEHVEGAEPLAWVVEFKDTSVSARAQELVLNWASELEKELSMPVVVLPCGVSLTLVRKPASPKPEADMSNREPDSPNA